MKTKLVHYSKLYHELMSDPIKAEEVKMPGEAYFIQDGAILALPRDDGDCRYPYGKDGFNYWTYASGYMHCNDGLFSPFLRANEGGEPKIAFFAGFEDVFSLLSVPVLYGEREDLVRYTIFTMGATYYITEVENMIFGIRTFVDDERHIYYTLEVVNQGEQPKTFFISTYMNPFIKNSLMENSTDRWFRRVTFHDEMRNEKNLGTFVVEAYEEKDRSSMTTNYGIIQRFLEGHDYQLKDFSYTTSRYAYVGGSRSSLHTPKALTHGEFHKINKTTSFTETAICGDLMHFEIKDSIRIDMRFSYTFDELTADKIQRDMVKSNSIDEILASIEERETKHVAGLSMSFGNKIISARLNEKVINPFMEHLKKQVEFCSVIKGYVQLSSFSLIGIRDVFQALEGLLFWQPKVAREKMLEALNFLNPEGRLPRQYSLPMKEETAPAMDLRPFIDQGTWVISTIATYLRYTKDFSFLEEICGYYDFIDEHKHLVRINEKKDSVLSHMLLIMEYLLKNRDIEDTNCVLALYGDWNDALDGLGKSMDQRKEYGTGVSVMATLQVYQNINEMIEILAYLDEEGYKSNIADYQLVQKEIVEGLYKHALLENKILHGWGDKKSYLVGSNNDPDGKSRDGITSHAFWILSGLYRDMEGVDSNNPAIKKMILEAFKRLNSKYGMKTFEPYFEKGTPGVGRIPNLPPGTAENGATYIHASMFGVMSLFALGEGKLAWEELEKLLPMTHDTISVSPYVVPNSYGLNEELGIDGESMQDWQTGSSNVLLKTFIRYVYGFEPGLTGIRLQPSRYQPFDSFKFKVNYLGHEIRITYKNEIMINESCESYKSYEINESNESLSRRFFINNLPIEGVYDSIMEMEILSLNDSFFESLEKGSVVTIAIIDGL